MTDAEIKNLRDLMRAATPGPWVLEDKERSNLVSNGEVWVEAVVARNYQEINDAALIVAVVNALPGLLDEVGRLRADAARYRWLRDVGDYMMPPTPGVIRLDINDHIEHLSGDALDAAIDAAMKEAK